MVLGIKPVFDKSKVDADDLKPSMEAYLKTMPKLDGLSINLPSHLDKLIE